MLSCRCLPLVNSKPQVNTRIHCSRCEDLCFCSSIPGHQGTSLNVECEGITPPVAQQCLHHDKNEGWVQRLLDIMQEFVNWA